MTLLSYDYRAIVGRIKAVVDLDKRPLKEILEKIEITPDQWSRKMQVNPRGTGGKKTSFTYEEYTRIANEFKAPEGWPFVDWGRAEAVDRALRVMEALAAAAPPSPREASPPAQSGKRRKAGG